MEEKDKRLWQLTIEIVFVNVILTSPPTIYAMLWWDEVSSTTWNQIRFTLMLFVYLIPFVFITMIHLDYRRHKLLGTPLRFAVLGRKKRE